MGLTVLPGCLWVNNDIPESEFRDEDPIKLSCRRVIGALWTAGVFERALLRQGVVSRRSEARDRLWTAFAEMDWQLF